MGLFGRLLRSVINPNPPDDLHWITPDIACSQRFADWQAGGLVRAGIRAVLDLRWEERHELAPLGKAGLHYLHVEVGPDATPSAAEIARVAGWVRHELDDDRKVLVHCSPSSTSATVLVAATLVRCGRSLDEALELTAGVDLSGSQLDALTHYATQLGR